MESVSTFFKIERTIVEDKKFLFTGLSYALFVIISSNLILLNSPIVGVAATLTYFLINIVFLTNFLTEDENSYIKFMFGALLLILSIGTVAWLVMIISNLDLIGTAMALIIVSTLCSILNRRKRMAKKIATKASQTNLVTNKEMPDLNVKDTPSENRVSVRTLNLWVLRIAYVFFVALSFYLLFASRSKEVHTVWEVIHPAFIPVMFASTSMLFLIIFSSETLSLKLVFVSVHTILLNTLFVFVFPASGDVGGQQDILGTTRLVYDNVVLHGMISRSPNFLTRLSSLFFEGFQTPFSVIYARMFAVDVFWTHLLFPPILWGVFVPLATFKVSKALGQSDNVSILSSLVFSAFPLSIIWGKEPVPMSLGFVTFFWALYFILKHLSMEKSKPFFALGFSAISFLFHFLSGMMAFLFLLLAMTLKRYERDKVKSPIDARSLLLSSFAFSVSVLPLFIPYVMLFTRMHPYLSWNKLVNGSLMQAVQTFLFGEYLRFDTVVALVFGLGEIIGFLSMIYYLKNSAEKGTEKNFGLCVLFLLLAYLILVADYRILKVFMVNPPFDEERLWLLGDLLITPFLAMAVYRVSILFRTPLKSIRESVFSRSSIGVSTLPSMRIRSTAVFGHVLLLLFLSAWTTASVYYAYPHFGPLQTTSYEIDAAKYIDQNTHSRYIVVCDQWFIYAGQLFYGVYNPRAFYFSHYDPDGVKLFMAMKSNPSPGVLIEAMQYNNATVAFFVVEEPRLGSQEFNRVIQEAQRNNLPVYVIFGSGKLYIFRYEK